MEEFRSNAMASSEHQELSRLSLQENFRLEPSASTDRSAQEVTHLLSDALETPNLCRFLVSRAWAKSTGEELTLRNMLSENGPHGIDGRSRGRPCRGRPVHLHLLH